MDLWRWFHQECERLDEAGHGAAAETLDALVHAMSEADHDRVDAVFPEALQIARALGNPWLEIFARHWNLQSRVFGRRHGTSALGEAVALVEFAHRPEHHGCPQAVCAVQDLAACYRNVDGPGYAEERLEVTRETLARIDPTWPCYRCVGGEHGEALEDAGRRDDAARFLADNRARVLEAGGDLGDRTTDTEILLRMGRADEALALLDGWTPHGKGLRVRAAIQRARALALLGRVDDAMAALPAPGAIEDTPAHHESWVDGVCRLIAAGRMPNDAAWGRTVRRFVARTRREGAHFPAFTLAARGVELAIDRGATAAAARDLEILRRIGRERRFPERARPVIDRLAERLAARIARGPAAPAAAAFADEAALGAALEAGAADDPEARLAVLESAHARWPDSERIALALAQTLLGLGFDEDAESLLRAYRARHPHEFAAASMLGELLLRARRDAELEALATPMLDGPSPSDGHYLLGRLALSRRRFARAVEHFAQVLEHHPDAIMTRVMWASAARHLGDFPAMLARLDELVERMPEEQPLHWDRMVAATLTGDWDKVRASAAAVGMELEGTGPIDLPGPLCRIRFQDSQHGSHDRWAVRNGPVTARIVEPVPEPAPQHYDDVVVFDAAPLDVPRDDGDDPEPPASEDPAEDQPTTFAAVAILRSGGYRTFVVDGPHPGEAAWRTLEQRLAALGCRIRVRSGEQYRLFAGQAELPGIYALVSIPSATAPADVHAALAHEATDHARPLTWADLAAAGGDEAAAAEHRARLQRYETGDPDPDPA